MADCLKNMTMGSIVDRIDKRRDNFIANNAFSALIRYTETLKTKEGDSKHIETTQTEETPKKQHGNHLSLHIKSPSFSQTFRRPTRGGTRHIFLGKERFRPGIKPRSMSGTKPDGGRLKVGWKQEGTQWRRFGVCAAHNER